MKKVFSLFILTISLACIIGGTFYILNHKGIRKVVEEKTKPIIEKVTSNESKTSLSEIYNIYLNKERHKVKLDYQLVKKSEETFSGVLYLYFDGKSVLEREVVGEQKISSIKDLFKEDFVQQYVRIQENDFSILKSEDIDYLLVKIGNTSDKIQVHYYILNNNGDLMKEEGILAYDSSLEFVTLENEDFPYYYEIDNENWLAKVNKNEVFALEEKNVNKKIQLIKYKYFMKDEKLKKEKIQIYEDVKLNEKSEKK